jgi:type IV pilus assembly protein PilN
VRANAQEFLNRPQNRNTRDESQFLNSLIERKAFSWTRVLENMEKVMPPRVHLVGISPSLNEDNQLMLKMLVAGDSRDRAIELTKHMEESKRFSGTQIITEHFAQATNGDTEQFDISTLYVPEPFVGADAAPADAKSVKPVKPASDAKPATTAPAKKAKPAKGGKS